MLKMAVTAAAALMIAAPALAEDWDFMLTNMTGKPIKTVEVSPAGAAKWTASKHDPEMKRAAVLKAGGKMTVHFDKGSGCKYDVRATYEDGATETWSGFNACDYSYITVNAGSKFKSM